MAMSASTLLMIMSVVSVALGQETCSDKTDGTCTFMGCDASRGPTNCVDGEGATFFTQKTVCVCQKGYCATADKQKCQKQFTADDVAAAKKTVADDRNATGAEKQKVEAAKAAQDHAHGVYEPLQKDADEKKTASDEAEAAFEKAKKFQNATAAAAQKAHDADDAAHKAQVAARDSSAVANKTLASDTVALKEGVKQLLSSAADVQEAQQQVSDAQAAGKSNLAQALKSAVATAIETQKKDQARLNELKNTEVASTQAAAQALREWRAAQATEASKLANQEKLDKARAAADASTKTDADKAHDAKAAADAAAKKAKEAKDELDAKTQEAEAAKKEEAAKEKTQTDDEAAYETASKTYNSTDLVAFAPDTSTLFVLVAVAGAASMISTFVWRRATRDSSLLNSRLIIDEEGRVYDAL